MLATKIRVIYPIIWWLRRQYRWILHSCAVFSLSCGSWKYGCKHHKCVVQSLGTDHNENMTYYSSLRNFPLLISSLNLWMLPSEIRFNWRLNERGYEHHSQYRPSAEVYQCTIHKYTTITVYNSTLLFSLHMVTYACENFDHKIFI